MIAMPPETVQSLPGHECRCIDCLRLRGAVVTTYPAPPEFPLASPPTEPRNRAERREKRRRSR